MINYSIKGYLRPKCNADCLRIWNLLFVLIWCKKYFSSSYIIQRKCQINLFSCIFELNSKNSNLDWKRRILETYESKFHRTFLAVKWDFPPRAQTSYIYFKRISKKKAFHIFILPRQRNPFWRTATNNDKKCIFMFSFGGICASWWISCWPESGKVLSINQRRAEGYWDFHARLNLKQVRTFAKEWRKIVKSYFWSWKLIDENLPRYMGLKHVVTQEMI